jgi:DNA (cytosine-5)-methyltransferase 1
LDLKIALAVEWDEEVAAVYESNQPDAKVRRVDVASIFDGILGSPATATEMEVAKQVGSCQILLGGPPCQGNSDLNNHTRREDPKNALYLLMARAAEILKPDIVIIENVGPVQWDKEDVVSQTKEALKARDYAVAGRVIDLRRVGVPQRRHRYLLIASKLASVVPDAVLNTLATLLSSETTFDSSSKATKPNIRRIDYLFKKGKWDLPNPQRPKCHKDKEHSYVSMYGRLRWDEPAQTITTGFGSMGQGRYVHPSQRRTITPHEAARIQTFPDRFDFGKNTRRGVLAKVIGNAVPPLLMLRVGDLILPGIKASMTGSGPDLNGASDPQEKLESTRRSIGPMPSSVEARSRMQATRQRDTTAEMALRRTLHAAGLRYRVDQAVLSGSKRRADLVFRSERVAVFVDGCFWHGCPTHGTQPKANGSWWLDKLESNRSRDRDTDRRLTEAGWQVIRVWEHEAAAEAAARIEMSLRSRRTRPER